MFQFSVVGKDDKPNSPQWLAVPRPDIPFTFRVVTDDTPNKPEAASDHMDFTDDEEIILPNFEVSSSSILPEPPEPPNLGRIAKTTAVRVLMNHSAADHKLKPICDRIYTNFFRAFSEWNVENAMKRRRKQIEIRETIDESRVYEARKSYENLKREAERWTNPDRTVRAMRRCSWSSDEPPERAEIDTRDIRDLITGMDKLSREISRCRAGTVDVADLHDKIAERAHASLV